MTGFAYEDYPEVPDFDPTGDEAATIGSVVANPLIALDWFEVWAQEDEQEWIIEPILPARRLVAVYSPPKVGKSLLMLEIAVAVSRGEEVLGYRPDRKRTVLYVDFENDPRGDVKERLIDMGYGPGDLGNLRYLSFPSMRGLDTIAGSNALMDAVARYEAELVVIDTVSRAVEGKENDNDTWLAFYRNTGLLLKKANCACVRLDHTGKDEEKGQRGGSAKYGDVDAVWKLTRVTETTFRLVCEANRMKVSEKEIVLTRLADPLRHKVEGRGWMAANDAATTEIIKILDEANAPLDAGRDNVRSTYLNKPGMKYANARISDAIRLRRARQTCPGQVDDQDDYTPVPDSSGQQVAWDD